MKSPTLDLENIYKWSRKTWMKLRHHLLLLNYGTLGKAFHATLNNETYSASVFLLCKKKNDSRLLS